MRASADNKIWGQGRIGQTQEDLVSKKALLRELIAVVLLVIGYALIAAGAVVLWGVGGGLILLGVGFLAAGVVAGLQIIK